MNCSFLYMSTLIYTTITQIAISSYNHHKTKRVSTVTSKSPLLPHFGIVSRIVTGIHLIPDCSILKGLQSCTDVIVNFVVIVQLVVS